MKKYILLSLVFAATISTISCTNTTKDSNSNSQSQISIPNNSGANSNDSIESLVLNDKTASPSSFLVNGTSIVFPNWDENNKLSIVNDPLPKDVLLSKSVSNFFNYPAETFAIVNDTIYFGDGSNNNNLASIKITDKSYTKLNNSNAHKITSYNTKVFYIDIPDNYTNKGRLYSYDTQSKETKVISPDTVGKYIINNNFIIYQNISDNSKLYKIKDDGTSKEKLTDFSVESFATYSSQLLMSNSDDNNNLYTINSSTKESKKIATMKVTDLKSFNQDLYFISGDDAKCLYKLKVDLTKPEATSTKLLSDTINEFYPTEKGIFVQKGINVNNPYIVSGQ
ncbi:DUF5050 domain-containing protein [Clostridium sp. SHJSY1]|uniref:DUF5050 domain-containing protein n=1 Tax=Clostridium sp. SHJSY1 TaxID=2942483 RepID=UPI00287475FF|nr:DUF5050 domain-containing protein [Clostridium sp. SHJSY1]MDS0525283.1 DUF5050 domain-containing protein [Clostridium sp. SHJSY1]